MPHGAVHNNPLVSPFAQQYPPPQILCLSWLYVSVRVRACVSVCVSVCVCVYQWLLQALAQVSPPRRQVKCCD